MKPNGIIEQLRAWSGDVNSEQNNETAKAFYDRMSTSADVPKRSNGMDAPQMPD